MWLYDTDVFNRWDVLEIAIIERGGKNNKVGWKPEKLCHTFWWREQNPGKVVEEIEVERPDVLGQVRYKGED